MKKFIFGILAVLLVAVSAPVSFASNQPTTVKDCDVGFHESDIQFFIFQIERNDFQHLPGDQKNVAEEAPCEIGNIPDYAACGPSYLRIDERRQEHNSSEFSYINDRSLYNSHKPSSVRRLLCV